MTMLPMSLRREMEAARRPAPPSARPFSRAELIAFVVMVGALGNLAASVLAVAK